MHHAAASRVWLKAMLMHKQGEGATQHLIHQYTRWLHLLPAAFPAHGDDAPVTAFKVDQATFLCGAVGLQLHEFQRRRHDVDDVSRVAVKLEHDFRTRGERCAGVENGRHDEVGLRRPKNSEQASGTQRPAERANPVREGQAADGFQVEAVGEFVVKSHLKNDGGCPDGRKRNEAEAEQGRSFSKKKQQRCAAHLSQHQRPSHPGDEPHVAGMIGNKAVLADLLKERVMHDLDGPDEPGKRPGDGEMEEKEFVRHDFEDEGCFPRRQASLQKRT